MTLCDLESPTFSNDFLYISYTIYVYKKILTSISAYTPVHTIGCLSLYITIGLAITGTYFNTCSLTSPRVVT